MISRDNDVSVFGELLDTKSISIINICGESGIGKSTFVRQLMNDNSFAGRMSGGYIDLGRLRKSSDSEMIDNLYELCDQLKRISSFKPFDFKIADNVDSKRSKRVSYSARESSSEGSGEMMDVALDLSDIASQFIDLTYLGTGLKAWKFFMRTYQKYKPASRSEQDRYNYYDSMDDRTLRESLPEALAADIRNSQAKGCRRIVMFIDNFNSESSELDNNKNDWLNKLIEKSEGKILWVLVSRKPVDSGTNGIRKLELTGIGDEKMREYLRNKVDDPEDLERIIRLCAGSPFYIHRILDLMNEKHGFSESDWNRLESNERIYIAREYLNDLGSDKKELLFMLSYATEFDRNIFHILFPERIFGLNDNWFNSSAFEHTGSIYSVQSSMADIIHGYLRELNPDIESECYGRLFDAERLLVKQMSAAGNPDLQDHLGCMCFYAKKAGNIRKHYNILKELKNLIMSGGNVKIYYDELKYLLDNCGDNNDIKLNVLSEITLLDYYRSDYSNAVKRCGEGRILAEKLNSDLSALEFIAIQMDIAHIAPSDVQNASDQVIKLAMEYISLLEKLRTDISYKAYVTNKINAHLYIAREYTIKENHTKSLEYMNYIFDVLNDPRKVNALELHDLYARAHEIMGNIYGEMGDHESEEEMQSKAVEAYNIAEAVQTKWDPEFYLNFGLAYKRYGESCLRRGDYDEGISAVEAAISKYNLVKSKNPEITDIYCKIGFACNDAAQYLIKHTEYDSETRNFLKCAEDTANEAIIQIEDFTGESSNGNRQLCNIRCTAARLSGKLFARSNMDEEAENSFVKALKYGGESIKAAPSHPYGHFGHGCACCDYASYLSDRGREKEAEEIALQGIRDISEARKCTDDPNAFSDVYYALENLCTLCRQ